MPSRLIPSFSIVLADRLLGLLARLPQRQAQLAGVQAGELHGVLDADGVAVEEQALDQREQPVMDLGRLGELAVQGQLASAS